MNFRGGLESRRARDMMKPIIANKRTHGLGDPILVFLSLAGNLSAGLFNGWLHE